VRDYAQRQGLSEAEALRKGMQEKSIEFVQRGGNVYLPS
jgi:phosphomethylpyrimidine synthase